MTTARAMWCPKCTDRTEIEPFDAVKNMNGPTLRCLSDACGFTLRLPSDTGEPEVVDECDATTCIECGGDILHI